MSARQRGPKRWPRRAGTVVAGVTVLITAMSGISLAGSLVANSKRVGAGRTTVTSCGDVSQIEVGYTVRSGTIQHITLSSIPGSCVGATMSLTLAQNSTDVGHWGPSMVSGTTMALTLSATPSATSPTIARIVMVGP